MRNVTIVGGGLAGLVAAIQLARAGVQCALFEKKSYPFHRVCGEYISNEALPFLQRTGLFPAEFFPPQISRLLLSSSSGKKAVLALDMGGFGISRHSFDNFLFEKAKAAGVDVRVNTEVTSIDFFEDRFFLKTNETEFTADMVIGAFGKRSRLDHVLGRSFIRKRSPFAAIKYHIRTEHPDDLIALHNFDGGYCGISNVESGVTNLCYLTQTHLLRRAGEIRSLEETILHQNPLLKYIWANSDFVFAKPEVINEISFASKPAVFDHILFAGDAAGMIAPVCGNGMAMAIHSAGIVSELALRFCRNAIGRPALEEQYALQYKKTFAMRLWKGRQIQRLFGSTIGSDIAINLALFYKPVANAIARNAHGKVF